MSKQATLANCLAKMYEGGKVDNSGASGTGSGIKRPAGALHNSLSAMEVKLNSLDAKVEQIASSQMEVLRRLDLVSQGVGDLERDLAMLRQERASGVGDGAPSGTGPASLSEVKALCCEALVLLRSLQQEGARQSDQIEGIGQSVRTVDRVIGYVGDTFKSSKIVEYILRGVVPWRRRSLLEGGEEIKEKPQDKGVKPKVTVYHRGIQVQDEDHITADDDDQSAEASGAAVKSTGHGTDPSVAKQPGATPAPLNSGPCLARIPAEQKGVHRTSSGDTGSKAPRRTKEVTHKNRAPARTQTFDKDAQDSGLGTGNAEGAVLAQPQEGGTLTGAGGVLTATTGEQHRAMVGAGPLRLGGASSVQEPVVTETSSAIGEEQPRDCRKTSLPAEVEEMSSKQDPPAAVNPPEAVALVTQKCGDSSKAAGVPKPDSKHKAQWVSNLSQSKPVLAGLTKVTQAKAGTVGESSQTEGDVKNQTGTVRDTPANRKTVTSGAQGKNPEKHLRVIDDCPPLPAPFEHRIVSAKQVPMGSYYALKVDEVLGGGRFGQVHKCSELSSGLTLAAKIIKVKGMKDREEVKNEISVMNQLNHVNLIQLYDAFETRTNLTLVMEYVEGGELFDRIVDENYHLTELDAIVFMRQICEGLQYLHRQYILHLDLKPENILCVSATGNQIKIIDFGLARKYRPREKLKVHFGTPEFLAPEVVNYDFVSFPTDMWSVGVITYMLLSGLSPFLGDTDTETMNNIVHSNWDFDAEAFENVSEEAKDFISQLLIPEKCSRLSASGCIKHSWLNNLEEKAKMRQVQLKSQLRLQRYQAAHRQWKKHFYAVTAANRLKKFRENRSINPA